MWQKQSPQKAADEGSRKRLFAFNGGFFWQRRVRRILGLAGYDLRFGLPSRNDLVAVWGRRSRWRRGRAVAGWRGATVISVEDAFLRSVQTGRDGALPLGLVIDQSGLYFDATGPSDLENILNSKPLDDPQLLKRARAAIAAIKAEQLSKYNANVVDADLPDAGYVLVIDQTLGDASIEYGGAEAATFKTMLQTARRENPEALIVIKTHPEVVGGHRTGHFEASDCDQNMRLFQDPVSPWALLEKASRVYCVTSLMGFEAVLARHRPVVFGQPFYCGWGLTDDRQPVARRTRTLSAEMVFAGAMILYPTWYDPHRDALCEIEDVIANLSAQTLAWRADRKGYVATGMRLWKRAHLGSFLKAGKGALAFSEPAEAAEQAAELGRSVLVWAGKETRELQALCRHHKVPLARMEDGFLRSRGLGAELVPPLSLVIDDLGIYYDPSRESRLERLIANSGTLGESEQLRALALQRRLVAAGVSKYNTGGALETRNWPQDRRKILVPGQVEDDASILLGAGPVKSNLALLQQTRAENPAAFLIYKPHPDVEAGLRDGSVEEVEALNHADIVIRKTDPIDLIEACDEVWTMTSLLGFEALLRGKHVTCLGAPFYAGWGLTRDLGPQVERRSARPTLEALIHCTLIAYPRYFDPETGHACPVEAVVDRLQNSAPSRVGVRNRLLSKLQGAFASYASVWR